MEESQYTITHTINSAKEFWEMFLIGGKFSDVNLRKFIFRGLKNKDYQLIPTALREDKIQCLIELCIEDWIKTDLLTENSEFFQIAAELDIIKQFFDIADRSSLSVSDIPQLRRRLDDPSILLNGFDGIKKWLPNNMFAIAGLAQHYGLPTRLLDWTYDYKVALYFAVSSFFDNCVKSEKEADALLCAINYEGLQWLDKNNDCYCLWFTRPVYAGNPNLAAQKGLFSLWQLTVNNKISEMKIDRRPLNQILINYINQDKNAQDRFENDGLFYKFIIPCEIKEDILIQLDRDGYTEAKLFPGYKGVSQYIYNRAQYAKKEINTHN